MGSTGGDPPNTRLDDVRSLRDSGREARVGDRRREDFGAFVAANGSQFLRTAYFLTGDLNTAEDLLQEVLERTYVAWPKIDEPYAYIRTALSRRAVNRWRLRARRAEVPLMAHHDAALPDGSDRLTERAAMVAALKTLPPRQRATVVLRFFDDLTEAETARTLGCSVGTVKSQTSKALAHLRRVMSGDLANGAAQEGRPA